jgi:hypothetical protein
MVLLRVAALVAAYLSAVLWLTWPTSSCPLTHLPSDTVDSLYSTWAMAWVSHSLATAPWSIADANIFAPERRALFYGPPALGGALLFAPVYALTGNAVLATHATFVGGLALTASSLHLVAWWWTRSHLAGLVAGATFLTTPWVHAYFVRNTPHWAALQWLPLIVALSAAQHLPFRRAALLTALVWLQSLTDPVYVAPAVLVPLCTVAGVRFAGIRPNRVAFRILAAAALATVLLLPVYALHASVMMKNPALERQTLWRDVAAKFRLTRLPRDLANPTRSVCLQAVTIALLGCGGALATIRGWRGGAHHLRREWCVATIWSFVGIWMSLGDQVVWGNITVPMAQGLLGRAVPALEVVRVPHRLGIAALIGLSLLSGLALGEISLWVRAHCRPQLARALLVAIAMAVSFQLYRTRGPRFGPAPAPGIEAPIREALSSASGSVIEAPVSGPYAAWDHAEAMLRSIQYWQPLLNGYSSYFPAEFTARMRLAAQLPDSAALDTLARTTGLRWIILDLKRLLPTDRERWEAAMRSSSASSSDVNAGLGVGADPSVRATAAGARRLRLVFAGEERLLLRVD